MRSDVLMAGTGGQGVLLIGQLLTQAACEQGLQVSYFPIYSPEVRGGSTTCTVVISDGAIGSPVSGQPGSMLLMDQVSVDTHLPQLRPGGLAVINSSLVSTVSRNDIRVVAIPATANAIEIGNDRIANMVMLGSYVAVTEAVPSPALEQALQTVLPERHHQYLPLNLLALQVGAQLVEAADKE